MADGAVSALEETAEGVLLHLRVQPNASRTELRIEADGRVRVALMAPPVEGAANKALRAYVARRFGVRRNAVTLVRGERSREKTVRVAGLSVAAARDALAQAK